VIIEERWLNTEEILASFCMNIVQGTVQYQSQCKGKGGSVEVKNLRVVNLTGKTGRYSVALILK
jgi:hypothetical protein